MAVGARQGVAGSGKARKGMAVAALEAGTDKSDAVGRFRLALSGSVRQDEATRFRLGAAGSGGIWRLWWGQVRMGLSGQAVMVRRGWDR